MRRTPAKQWPDGGPFVGAYAAVLAVVSMAGLGALAIAFRQPLLFPSLGPTVMVLAERPRSASAHPRNVLVGHAVGIAAGVAGLAAFGLLHHPSVIREGVTAARVGAADLSLAVTTYVLQVFRSPHAPAGATTLIVSLGLLTTWPDLLAMAVAVVLVTVIATVANLALGARRTLHAQAGAGDAPRHRDRDPQAVLVTQETGQQASKS